MSQGEWSDQQLIEAIREAAQQRRTGRAYCLNPWVLDAVAARLEALAPSPDERSAAGEIVTPAGRRL